MISVEKPFLVCSQRVVQYEWVVSLQFPIMVCELVCVCVCVTSKPVCPVRAFWTVLNETQSVRDRQTHTHTASSSDSMLHTYKHTHLPQKCWWLELVSSTAGEARSSRPTHQVHTTVCLPSIWLLISGFSSVPLVYFLLAASSRIHRTLCWTRLSLN